MLTVSVDDFLKVIENWEPSQKNFATVLSALIKIQKMNHLEFARKFEVPPSTIKHWAEGRVIPHEVVQKKVIHHFKNKLKDRKKLK